MDTRHCRKLCPTDPIGVKDDPKNSNILKPIIPFAGGVLGIHCSTKFFISSRGPFLSYTDLNIWYFETIESLSFDLLLNRHIKFHFLGFFGISNRTKKRIIEEFELHLGMFTSKSQRILKITSRVQ